MHGVFAVHLFPLCRLPWQQGCGFGKGCSGTSAHEGMHGTSGRGGCKGATAVSCLLLHAQLAVLAQVRLYNVTSSPSLCSCLLNSHTHLSEPYLLPLNVCFTAPQG
jgi:hypothetical protein